MRKISTRQVLLLKPLQNDNKFLTALLNWQNVFSLSSDLTANLGRRYGQRGPVYLKSSLRDTPQAKWRLALWKGVLRSGPEKAIHKQWLLAAPCTLYNLPLQRSNPLPTVSKSRTRVSSVLCSQNSVRIKVRFFNFFCVE